MNKTEQQKKIKAALTAKSSTVGSQSFASLVDEKLLNTKTSGISIVQAFRAFSAVAKAFRSPPEKTTSLNKRP